ncbi:pyruvate ferredoxin oxidoreductase [miscellaneous Crenarchaeota group archaeon SMTZ-80]|nr:MAG: pyruvate ferredoxin oxidoreductase [miscellaneous Crenarchaeota group archaeon SMTZ-80]
MVAIKDLPVEELYLPGHRLCPGCGPSIAIRMMMKAAGKNTIVTTATGCMEVGTTLYPYTSWLVPWVHTAFENIAATASGIEAAYKAMGRRSSEQRKVNIIALGGDGGTFDIGIQALSGALERGHNFLYLCYDNEAYMNTGIQRSGATPHGASTTTSWGGTKIPGKPEWKKDLIGISIAHGIEFAATASIAYWNDFITKVKKALDVDGPAVIHILAPCPRGWRYEDKDTFKLARLATQTRYFPIYEFDKGKYTFNIKVPNPLPVEEFLKAQGRFKHLFKPEYSNEIQEIQEFVDKNWDRLEKLTTL